MASTEHERDEEAEGAGAAQKEIGTIRDQKKFISIPIDVTVGSPELIINLAAQLTPTNRVQRFFIEQNL